ncbi:hypothetical protein [Salinicoccus albus]|nr:hypothetical protein [Salinicoccus albus]
MDNEVFYYILSIFFIIFGITLLIIRNKENKKMKKELGQKAAEN